MAMAATSSSAPVRRQESPMRRQKTQDKIILRKNGKNFVFKWNGRECEGNDLHVAVLAEDVEQATGLLDSNPTMIKERFVYHTHFMGGTQKGTGEAIHLAVTRGSVPMVELLIARKASVEAKVERDGVPHYDVLHTGVVSEGRGGQEAIIQALLEAKAPPTMDLDGHYPLHKAYKNGGRASDYIPLLAKDMDRLGLLQAVERLPSVGESSTEPPRPTPLQLGITSGKITSDKLAKVASLTQDTLLTFVRMEPRSIPAFIERLQEEQSDLDGKRIAEVLTIGELCNALREFPAAGTALLEASTVVPDNEHAGWHPVPTRLSFAPRTSVEKFRNMFNKPRIMYVKYVRSKSWEFDVKSFTKPEWHDDFITDFGPPTVDVQVKVCLIPELVCPQFVMALSDADDEDIFATPVVHASLSTIWWGGAFKVDLLQLFITVVGLILLVSGQVQEGFEPVAEAAEEESRRLATLGSPLAHFSQIPGMFRAVTPVRGSTIARDFIGARGIVDIIHEVWQVGGYIRTSGNMWSYITDLSNLMDLARAMLAVHFYLNDNGSYTHVLLIALYWVRTLEITVSETLMYELMPITRLMRSLGPSLTVCITAMCAFTHAKWVMHNRLLWPDTIYDSFTLLITAGLPPADSGTSNLFFAYGAVLCFTIFFLNIFIGVISEIYAEEKEHVSLNFRKRMCGLCMNYLIRAQVLPCRLMSRRASAICLALAFMSMGGAIVWQTLWTVPAEYTWIPFTVTVLSQLLGLLVCYQDHAKIWSQDPRGCTEEPRHMWMARPIKRGLASPLESLDAEVQQLRADVAALTEAATRKQLQREPKKR